MAQLEDMFIIVMIENGNGELLGMFQRCKWNNNVRKELDNYYNSNSNSNKSSNSN